MKRLLALLVPIVAVLATALPASANSIEIHQFTFDETNTISGLCSYDIQEHAVGTGKETDFIDANGNIIKLILTNSGLVTFTLSANGVSTTSTNTLVDTITFNPDGSVKTNTFSGLATAFVVPGGGVVLLDAGRLVLDADGNIIFEGGPHQLFGGDFDALCTALSGS